MEYRSPDPEAVVRGANVKATLDAFKQIPTLGKSFVSKYFLPEELREDTFVPVQSWLDALRDIRDEVGEPVLREVGRYIVENADFPPQFKTVKDVLLALDDIYHLNHRGEVGHYHAKVQKDGSIVVRCETPYPAAFEHGLVEGISANPRLL
ncbi:MAG TPA: hypothetical protein VND93_07940, partial [Myxococcales bacterium]|nr:hypothetical protein [Myxococcales bacterium]